MSWFGSSFNESLSNIKGQIVTLTKEVLTDDNEDEADSAPNEVDAMALLHKQELEGQSKSKLELEERLRSAELQYFQRISFMEEKLKSTENELKAIKNKGKEWDWDTQPSGPSNQESEFLKRRLQETVDQHQSELVALQDSHSTEISRLRKEIEEARNERRCERKNIEAPPDNEKNENQIIGDLRNQVTQLFKECQMLKEEKKKLSSDMEELDAQHQNAIEVICEKKAQLSDQSAKDRISALEKSQARSHLLQKSTEIENLSEAKEPSTSDFDELKIKEGVIHQLQAQLEKTNMEIESQKHENIQLQEKIILAEEELKKIRVEKEAALGEKDKAVTNKERLQAENSQAVMYLREKLDEREEKILQYGAMLEERENVQKSCYVQHQKDLQLIAAKNDEIKTLQKQIIDMNQTYPDVKSKVSPNVLKYFEKLITDYSLSSFEELPSAIAEKNSELASLRCERDKLHEDLRESQELNEVIESDKIDLEKECEDLRDQLEELQFGERQQPEGSVRGLPTIEEEEEESVDWRQRALRLQLQVTTLSESCQSLKQQLEDKRDSPYCSPEKDLTQEHRGSFGSQESFDKNENTVENQDLIERDLRIRNLEAELASVQNALNMEISAQKDSKIKQLEDELFSVQGAIDKEKSLTIYKSDQIDELKDGVKLIGELFGLENANLQQTFIKAKEQMDFLKSKCDCKSFEAPVLEFNSSAENEVIVKKIAFKAVQDDAAIERLASGNEELIEKLDKANLIIESMSNKNVEFASEIKNLGNEVNYKTVQINNKSEIISDLEKKLVVCQEETAKLRDYFEKIFTEQTNSNSIKDSEISELKSHLESVQSQNSLKDAEMKNLTSKLNDLIEDQTSKMDNVENCNKEIEKLTSDLKLTLDENIEIKKIIEKEKTSHAIIIKEHDSKIAAMSSEVSQLSDRLELSINENTSLQTKLANCQSIGKDTNNSLRLKDEKIAQLENQLHSIQSTLSETKDLELNEHTRVKELELKINDLTSQNSTFVELNKTYSDKIACSETMASDFEKLTLKEKQQDEKILENDLKLSSLQNDLNKTNTRIKEKNQIISALEQKIASMESDKTLVENCDNAQISQLQEKLECYSNENNQLQLKIDEYIVSINELQSQNSELRNTYSKKEECLQSSEVNIYKLSSEKAQLINDSSILQEENIYLKSNIEKLSTEYSQLQSNLNDAKEEIIQLKENLNILNAENSKLKSNFCKNEEELKNSQDKYNELYSQCENLQGEKQQLIETSKQKHLESISYYEQLQKLSLELIQVKEEAAKDHSASENIEIKDKQIVKLEEEVGSKNKELESCNKKISKLLNDLSKSELELQSLKKKNEQLMTANSSFNSQYESRSKELTASLEKEKYLQTEIMRLKEHLMSIEESNTSEALEAKQREATLKQTIAKLHDKISSHSNLYSSTKEKHTDQMVTLEEKFRDETIARLEAISKLSAAEEQSFQHQEGVKRLQQVLNDFQKSHSKEIYDATESERKKLKEEKDKNSELQNEINNLKRKLDDLEICVSTVNDMKVDLQTKEDTIVAFKSQVSAIQQAAKKSQDQLQLVRSSFDGKIDKNLIRNLFVGYFATGTDKRREVLHVIAQVLEFSSDERTRIGLDTHPGSWMTSVANFLAPPPSNIRVTSKVDVLDHTSLSQAFIRFLEDESTIRPLPKLPAVKMAEEVNEKAKKKQSNSQSNGPTEGSSISPLLDASLTPSLSSFQPVATEQVSEHKYLQNLLDTEKITES